MIQETEPGVVSTISVEDWATPLPDGSILVSRRTGKWGDWPAQPDGRWLWFVSTSPERSGEADVFRVDTALLERYLQGDDQ